MINARAETVAEKPAFRRAFAKHRCLLPADGFYEWVTNDPKTGDPDAPRKQPYYIYREDGGVLAFAGLYERWHDKNRPDDDPAACCGRPPSSPPGPRTRSAGSTTGCRW